MKIIVINGANLNMLGIREPEIYGNETYEKLKERIERYAENRNIEVKVFQSNSEGALIDAVQSAYFDGMDGIIINPGAYTHTSIGLLDALSAVKLPAVEVHISDIDNREDFRKISYIRSACIKTVSGHGTDGYIEAMDILTEYISKKR